MKERCRRTAASGHVLKALEIVRSSVGDGGFDDSHVEIAVKLVERISYSELADRRPTAEADSTDDLEEGTEARGQGGSPSVVTHGLGARDVITSDRLCDLLEKRVLAVRERVFGARRRPFRSDRAARKWIEITAQEEFETAGLRRGRGVSRRVEELGREIAKLSNCVLSLSPRSLDFPAKDQSGLVWSDCVRVPPGGKIRQLYDFVHEVAKIGFQTQAVTWWVLRSIRPVLPRFRVTTSGRWINPDADGNPGARRQCATLDINAVDLSWEELWPAYKQIRDAVNVKRKKLNPFHLRIVELVEKAGIPETGKMKFWEGIRRALIDEGAWRVPSTPHAIRKAYKEFKKKERMPETLA